MSFIEFMSKVDKFGTYLQLSASFLCVAIGAMFLFTGCSDAAQNGGSSGNGGNGGDNTQPGTLVFRTATTQDTTGGGTQYGNVYAGVYTASDGAVVDAWVSVREDGSKNSHINNFGSINKIFVVVQGGTGGSTNSLLGADNGLHKVQLAINYRGSSVSEITDYNSATRTGECPVGPTFVSCLKTHSVFSKITPKLNAQDINYIIAKFTSNQDVMVNNTTVKAQTLLPSGVDTNLVNLYTASFGGVVLAYMLAEDNAPALHNVFIEQVTGVTERPISDGLSTADRLLDTLYTACEGDTTCNSAYPSMRTEFREFMSKYANTSVMVDGTGDESRIYAGGVFDRIMHIIDEEEKVGKAIRYIGEISNDHAVGNLITVPASYRPTNYATSLGERPRTSYGFPALDGNEIQQLLQAGGMSFFPGITNRTGMICSWGINRPNGDSTARFDTVKAQKLTGDSGGTKEDIGYGFLVSYATFLSICPQLSNESRVSGLPSPTNISANNVIVYRGGLDIKHAYSNNPSEDEYITMFTQSNNHRRVIQHTFLSQAHGQDSTCLSNVFNRFWSASDTTNTSLGDNCEESNSYTASSLDGWS